MSEPANLLADVEAERAKYGPTMTNHECVALCNAVAWKNRAASWGISGKQTGNYGVRQPDGVKAAVDILHHRDSNIIVDCLISAGSEGVPGPATPGWIVHGEMTDPSRPWVAPIDPTGGGGNGGGGPVDPPPPPSTPMVPYQSYVGDAPWHPLGITLERDYIRGGHPGLNAQSVVWMARVIWDATMGEAPGHVLSIPDSIAKHRREWCAILGIEPD